MVGRGFKRNSMQGRKLRNKKEVKGKNRERRATEMEGRE
jgi:hypothetical protein